MQTSRKREENMIGKIQNFGQNFSGTQQNTLALDNEIIEKSAKRAKKAMKKSKAEKLRKALYPATVATIIATSAALSKTSLSGKAAVAALGAVDFAILGGSFKVADKVSKKVLPKEKENSPLNTIATIFGGFALYRILGDTAAAGMKSVANNHPSALGHLKSIGEKIDNSKTLNNIAKGVAKPFVEFGKKFPKISSGLKKYAFPITLAAYVGGSILLSGKVQKIGEKEFEKSTKELSEKEA